MAQKVDPRGLRLKINKHWVSRWYAAPRYYAEMLHEDLRIRAAILQSPLTSGGEISHIDIIRYPEHISLIINTGRPGVIIGAKGENIEKIGKLLQPLSSKKIQIKINEENQTNTNAQIVAKNVARLLRIRSAFRRVMKIAMENAMRDGALGIKMKISGRLGGAEMSRSVLMIKGRVPLHTLRADIDYGFAESFTTYGSIGIKVWIFKGEIYRYHAADPSNLLSTRRHRREKEQRGGPHRRGTAPAAQRTSATQSDDAPKTDSSFQKGRASFQKGSFQKGSFQRSSFQRSSFQKGGAVQRRNLSQRDSASQDNSAAHQAYPPQRDNLSKRELSSTNRTEAKDSVSQKTTSPTIVPRSNAAATSPKEKSSLDTATKDSPVSPKTTPRAKTVTASSKEETPSTAAAKDSPTSPKEKSSLDTATKDSPVSPKTTPRAKTVTASSKEETPSTAAAKDSPTSPKEKSSLDTATKDSPVSPKTTPRAKTVTASSKEETPSTAAAKDSQENPPDA